MGKEKKRTVDEQEKEETLFYYELIGIVFIIVSITILGELGKLGTFFTILFKVTFGDWYWIFLVFLLFFGFVNLFKHKSFDFKNQRFIGFVFICFGLLIFAHFPLHNYIQSSSNAYFSETWKVYKAFINTEADMYLGGGLVGSVMFYIVYYLFGAVGVVLVALLIMMLGLSLIIKMPIIDMFRNLWKNARKVGKFTGNFNHFFKYKLGNEQEKKEVAKNIFSKSQQIPLKILEEYQNVMNYNFQEKLCTETRSLIHTVFNNLNIEYRDLDFTISYKITTYKFTMFSEYDLQSLANRLNNIIEEHLLIAQEGNNLIIQIINKYPQILTMRELLMKQNNLYNNYVLPIGLTYENKLCEVDLTTNGNLLLIGSSNSGLKNFINYYIFGLFVKEDLIKYEFEIYDPKNEFYYLHHLIKINNEDDINAYLNLVIGEIDNKLEIINKNATSTIDEYNKKLDIDNCNEARMKRKFIIINKLECDKETYSYFENKIMYVTQLGEKAGVTVVYLVRDENYITSIVLSLFVNKLVFKLNSSYFSSKVLNNDNATYLEANGDCLYLSQVKARRLQTPLVSKKDLESIKDYLK